MKKKKDALLSVYLNCQCICECEVMDDFNSEEDLWNICECAYSDYQRDILNGKKKYSRYVADVISFNLPIASRKIIDWKFHSRNVSAVHEILNNRIDLVKKYFAKPDFCVDDMNALMDEFNLTGDYLEKEFAVSDEMGDECASFVSALSHHISLGDFNNEQLQAISDFVNKNVLFVSPVTPYQMYSFFQCLLDDPLVSSDTRKVAMFLSSLRNEHLIVHNWQKIIGEHCLLKSSANGVFISQSGLSSSLNLFKKQCVSSENIYATFAKSLLKMQ